MGANEDLLIAYCMDCSTSDAITLVETNLVDLNINDSEPLRTAVNNGCPSMVDFLISAGADFNSMNQICLRTAVTNMDYEITQLLLEAGANPNVPSEYGMHDSAFYLADNMADPSMNSLIGPF